MNRKCIFLDIIGSMPDENENTNKIGGYYQVTNGILIKNFVIKLLNMKIENVKIYAYGIEQNYDQFIHTNNKCYHQFDLNNFFQMTAEKPDFNFIYFYDFKQILFKIENSIKKYSSVIIFLDDLGSKKKFSKINYFSLYQIFLKYPEKSFLVFNDSCFSGSLINLIEAYNKIYELKAQKSITDEMCLQIIFSFSNLFKSILKKGGTNKPIDKVSDLVTFYQKNEITNQIAFKKLFDLLNSGDKTIEKIREFGFRDSEEIVEFQLIYNSFETKENFNEDEEGKFIKYRKSREVFTTSNLDMITALINNDLQEFIHVINILDVNRENINFLLPPNQNVEIITSTDDKNKCFSYTSIRTNGVTKVYPGSPAMSSFIKELFMRNDENLINFDKMKIEMCGTEDKTIFYPVRIQERSFNGHIKREWASLFPKHYKSGQKNIFSFTIPEQKKKNIAALRAISFIISQKSKEIANSFQIEVDPSIYNHSNDPFADIIAITAILKEKSKIKEIIDRSINENEFYKKHELFGIDLILSLIEFAFYSTKDKVQMITVIMNCLKIAIKKEINKSITSIGENVELVAPLINFILVNEIQYFSNIKSDINSDTKIDINDDKKKIVLEKREKKLEIINEIENAVFALLDPDVSFFAYLVASLILDDINVEDIKKSDFIIDSSNVKKIYQQFIENKNIDELKENKFRKFAESRLFSYVKLSLDSLNSICDIHIKNDTMKIVSKGLESQNSLFLVKLLSENIKQQYKISFVQTVIEPIENIASSRKIPTFFIPAIIALLPKNEIFYALYSSLTSLENNWYENVIKLINDIINNCSCTANEQMNYQYLNMYDLNELAENALKLQKNINEKTKYDAEIVKIKDNYNKAINQSINKIIKLVGISVKRVRGNISQMIHMKILEKRIDENYQYFESIEENKYNDKFHDYLYASISEFMEKAITYMNNAKLDENLKEEFEDHDLLKKTDDLYKKAVTELNTISYIFSISDESLYHHNNELSKTILSDRIDLQVSVMFARALCIVEISPISCLLDMYGKQFESFQGNNPNIKEIMGLLGANIFIPSLKDKHRQRSKVNRMKKPIKNDKGENSFESEYDSYYSSDDGIDDVPYRPTQIKSGKDSIQIVSNMPKILWHKDQLSRGIIEDIQKKLRIGRSGWIFEAWITFVYCFNERMSDIGLKFDPNDQYKKEFIYCNIREPKSIIESFYPLHQIIDFWLNEYKIQLFVGKYKDKAKEIFRAMIRAFDDSDRIVTPIHMFRETYEERTPAILNRIFDY